MADRSGSSWRSGGRRSHRGQPSVDHYGDLEEVEVWSAMMERGGGGGDYSRGFAAPRMIPRGNPVTNEARTPHRSSAPMNIPDWTKIYGKADRCGSGPGSGSGSWADFCHYEQRGGRGAEDEDEEEAEDDSDGIVPPHEWIARKLARTQISSSSMCEGMGRTLKGRDLSKVRNAILTKTGFLE